MEPGWGKRKSGSIFGQRNLNILALGDTKLNGKGKEWSRNTLGVKLKGEQEVVTSPLKLWDCVKECTECDPLNDEGENESGL